MRGGVEDLWQLTANVRRTAFPKEVAMLSHVVQTRGTAKAPSTAPGEPALVIEHREALIYLICAAAELEHALMCEYLFAGFSLKESTDEGLSEEQLSAVDRWRATVLGVAGQEMLHLALTANMLSALGASPHLARPNLPQPARHYPAAVRLAPLPFGEQALRHFLYLERPEGTALDDPDGLGALGEAMPLMAPDDIVPHAQEFSTVGHLYRSIEADFRHLVDKFGPERVFVGPRPLRSRRPRSGGPTRCRHRPGWRQRGYRGDRGTRRGATRRLARGAFRALQGRPRRVPRPARRRPAFEPARPVVAARVRPGEGGATGPLITDTLTAKVADLSNVIYEVLLEQQRLLNQALFEKVYIREERTVTVTDAVFQVPFDDLLAARDIAREARIAGRTVVREDGQVGTLASTFVNGSKRSELVEVTGLEPATSTMRTSSEHFEPESPEEKRGQKGQVAGQLSLWDC
jgi:Ferritin-like